MLVASVQQNTATGAAFSVAVHSDRAYVVVAPAGELDMSTLDLRGLTFVDSSGLNFVTGS
jgi:hypothetical protein